MESQSKPGTKMVYPEPCQELRRRPQLVMAGIVPYQPSSTRVMIVAHGLLWAPFPPRLPAPQPPNPHDIGDPLEEKILQRRIEAAGPCCPHRQSHRWDMWGLLTNKPKKCDQTNKLGYVKLGLSPINVTKPINRAYVKLGLWTFNASFGFWWRGVRYRSRGNFPILSRDPSF